MRRGGAHTGTLNPLEGCVVEVFGDIGVVRLGELRVANPLLERDLLLFGTARPRRRTSSPAGSDLHHGDVAAGNRAMSGRLSD